MTKEELKEKVAVQSSIIDNANNQIYNDTKEYIKSLPYKEGDMVSTCRADVCWISSITPDESYGLYTGEINVRVNPAKKDGNPSNRLLILREELKLKV